MITNDKFLVTFYDNTKVSKDIQKAIFMMNIEQRKKIKKTIDKLKIIHYNSTCKRQQKSLQDNL